MEKILIYGMTSVMGGTEAYIMSLYRFSDKDKIQFDFVCDFPTMAYSEEVITNGSLVHHIPSKSSNPIKHLFAFKKILKDHPEYKKVYFNVLNAGAAFTMWVAKRMKRKVYVHSHNSSDENMRLHNLFKPALNKYADKRFACSDLAAEHMFYNTDDVMLVNNAIDVKKFIYSEEKRSYKRKELKLTDNDFVLFHAGRIAPQKNPRFLIEIFSKVVEKRPDAILLYAGVGPMEQEIKELAQQKGVQNNIRFLGMRSDVDELYQSADAFILPSVFEGLGIVLIEAQAAGLPVFVSDCVPPVTKITELLSFISLEKPADYWAEKILASVGTQRRDMSKEIEAAGYSIEKEVSKIQKALLG